MNACELSRRDFLKATAVSALGLGLFRLSASQCEAAAVGSTAAPVAHMRSLGGTSAAEAPTLVNVDGPLAAAVAPAELSRRPRLLRPSLRCGRCPMSRLGPPRSPNCAPVPCEGTCGGIFNAVGQESGSPFRLLATA